ncbi:hypothetical protein HanPSC8_Chr07g0291261 [Helianthus annuus]|nr:hypothetical protein HanIR_Chr07g0324541 [Helianthus annuus]KAJ0905202.1 hypothetical protein HanPSC8_Chr07g0291261 [Helianthus annuus]
MAPVLVQDGRISAVSGLDRVSGSGQNPVSKSKMVNGAGRRVRSGQVSVRDSSRFELWVGSGIGQLGCGSGQIQFCGSG